MRPELVVATIAWFLAAVLLAALAHKLRHWPRFVASAQAYRLVPNGILPVALMMLTAVEATTLVLLVAYTLAGAAPAAFLICAGLFAFYLSALLINVLRGRRYIDCGCGDAPVGIGPGVLLRNLVLIGLALAAWYLVPAGASGEAGLSLFAQLVALAFAAVALGLYQACEQMLANRTLHRRLWLEAA